MRGLYFGTNSGLALDLQPRWLEPILAKILLVDDQRDIRFVMGELLESLGHQVVHASSAPRGLELLETERPDLIFLDLSMPEMSGTEALARIRSRESTCDARVLLLTAAKSGEDLDDARNLGIEGIIPKPWESEDVATQVASVMIGFGAAS